MVQRSLSIDLDGLIQIDSEIIGALSKRDLKTILSSMQRKYETGFSLEKISVKLHEYFNWKNFEYYPNEESKNKWMFVLKYYEKFGNKRSATYTQTISLLNQMIRMFDERKEETKI